MVFDASGVDEAADGVWVRLRNSQVREVIEKERTISSVAASYDLVAQTVGNWVARYRKERATDQDWTARCMRP